ncbi:MAG TPA: sulfite exporter TauE/SafE family protein [Alphaproteobacteria bacterium]|nr:sulfite exporter TauE/SafE family protein [Alphaproteobacteria bacterium]
MAHSVLSLLGAGLLAGAMNAVAGGGSFVTLPALIHAGLPSVAANASSTVALFPGSLASAWAYRADLVSLGGVRLRALLAASLVGGAAGAALLLATPAATFDAVIPWLLLLATLALAFGRRLGAALRRRGRPISAPPVLAAQFLLAVYGGYFGGAVGIMMMAVWGLIDGADLRAMNPAKTVLVAATNAIAVLCFAVAGAVRWPETLAVLVSAALGGYAGARLARRLDARLIRAGVVAITAAITVAFFLRAM